MSSNNRYSQMKRLTDVKAVFKLELNFKAWKPEKYSTCQN